MVEVRLFNNENTITEYHEKYLATYNYIIFKDWIFNIIPDLVLYSFSISTVSKQERI